MQINDKIIYVALALFVIFAVISILYIFPSLKNKEEENNIYYINDDQTGNTSINDLSNKNESCNINKEDLEKKSKSIGLSYEIYEVKVPEKI